MIGTCTDGPYDVLLIDSCAETRTVLETALKRRGMRMFSADQIEGVLSFFEHVRPRVTILDPDAEVADNQSLYQLLNRGATGNLIVLGTARPGQKKLRGDRVYGKPYHFGPLIRTIELLCSEPQATEM